MVENVVTEGNGANELLEPGSTAAEDLEQENPTNQAQEHNFFLRVAEGSTPRYKGCRKSQSAISWLGLCVQLGVLKEHFHACFGLDPDMNLQEYFGEISDIRNRSRYQA